MDIANREIVHMGAMERYESKGVLSPLDGRAPRMEMTIDKVWDNFEHIEISIKQLWSKNDELQRDGYTNPSRCKAQ